MNDWIVKLPRAVLCALVAAAGAAGAGPGPGAEVQRLVRSAPAAAVVAGHTLRLDAYAWRDFQSVSPPGGRPLRVRVQVAAAAGCAVPDGLDLDGLWVSDGSEWWELNVESAPPTGAVEALGVNGPKLDPGTLVDVVARIREPAGTVHWIRAAAVAVQRTS